MDQWTNGPMDKCRSERIIAAPDGVRIADYKLPILKEVRMIVVRNTFVCKPGCASKLAAQLKEAMASRKDMNARILTDLTGDFNRVVMEFEGASFGDFE